MTRRKLDALRNLAERPGTPAEGRVAREKLRRAEAKQEIAPDESGRRLCECGYRVRWGDDCRNMAGHDRIRVGCRERFPRGARVYYNRWAYAPNCPGVVIGYSDIWNWARVQFDHLKTSRRIPVYGRGQWHLSTEPLTAAEMIPLRGGMERFEVGFKL